MSPEFPCILVPTDFSALGNEAVAPAFRLAEAVGQRVVLVHVLEDSLPSPLYAHYYPTPSPEARRELEQSAARELERLVPAGARVPHEVRIGRGAPAAELCRIAREAGAKLIVVSSHGRTGVPHLMLGSVAERVVHQAPCSVLVLRSG